MNLNQLEKLAVVNVLTRKVVATYSNEQHKAAIEYMNYLDGSCGKSIYAVWEVNNDQIVKSSFDGSHYLQAKES